MKYVLKPIASFPVCAFSAGDTLLAIRAPIGTQLEVPIPETVNPPFSNLLTLGIDVLNGQRKYQIRLKSSSGPIEVLLVNKDSSSASPVVLPVPPPDDVLQNLPASTPTSQPPSAASQVSIHNMQLDLFIQIMSGDLLEDLMSSEVFSPLLRLSPPPSDHDYIYNLDETEGLCDLFDVPILNL
uniref:E2F transcription factor 4 n=1 Tax=Sphaeramia orbicularis TaxID=375764 RepID=A0A672ZHH8_9TELE